MRNWSCNTYQLFVNSTRPACWTSHLFACLSLHSSSSNVCYRHCSPKRYFSIFMFIRMHPASPSVTLWICVLASWLDVEWYQTARLPGYCFKHDRFYLHLLLTESFKRRCIFYDGNGCRVYLHLNCVKTLKKPCMNVEKLKGFSLQKTIT